MSERDGFEPGVGWEAENLMPPDHPGQSASR